MGRAGDGGVRRRSTSSTAPSAPWRRRTSRSSSPTPRSATWASACSAWPRSRRTGIQARVRADVQPRHHHRACSSSLVGVHLRPRPHPRDRQASAASPARCRSTRRSSASPSWPRSACPASPASSARCWRSSAPSRVYRVHHHRWRHRRHHHRGLPPLGAAADVPRARWNEAWRDRAQFPDLTGRETLTLAAARRRSCSCSASTRSRCSTLIGTVAATTCVTTWHRRLR